MTEQKNIKDIPRRLLEFVEAVSNENDLRGSQKKKIVLDKVVEEFQLDLDMVLMVSDLIDLIVDIAKNKHKIKTRAKALWRICC
jgi:hypothetical protein